MCETCGCANGANVTVVNLRTGKAAGASSEPHDGHAGAPAHEHGHADHGTDHAHHAHDHHHHRHGHGTAVSLEQAVLAKNDALAGHNRAWLAGREIFALNLVSGPGAGKTTLLERTLRDLAGRHEFFVIEGDQATSNDGERIKAAGAPAVQINTGSGCHLDASMVARGLAELKPSFGSVIFIENVGNLVCPALFDLGESAKVAILSLPEGEDKPIKYPHMFRAADLLLINKIDLLPHLDFDLGRCLAYARQVNPDIDIITVSARAGTGLDDWYNWISAASRRAREAMASGLSQAAPSGTRSLQGAGSSQV
jgi:hydrogenase nickel incorporation protein HypB